MEVEVRNAKTDDWQLIQKLINEVFQSDSQHDDDLDLNRPFSAEGIDYYKKIARGDTGSCFIAEVEDKPVGYIFVKKKRFGHRKSSYAEVENMGVSPDFRSQGIGAILMNKACEWAKAEGIKKIYLGVYSKNLGARSFYKKEGYQEIVIQLEKTLL